MRLLKALITLFLALVLPITGSASPNTDFVYSGLAGDARAPWLVSWQAPILEVEGLRFKDLNKNGVLDLYEDWRLSPAQRAEDLIAKMDSPEKAAQLLHITLYSPRAAWFTEQNVGFALAYDYLSAGPTEAAVRVNQLQQWSESSKYGIPLIISMDSVNGASWVRGATLYPDQIGLAATRDPELVGRLNEMQRVEMTAMGIRMSLSPIADLATEPRWGRLQECFGEDAELAKEMVVAAVLALQAGSELNCDSVLVSVKHFPGSGPQAGGVDGSPIIFTEDSISLHLSVFEGAIAAGAGSIMPYGYSEVPFLEGDAAQRPAHESRVVMTELLREKLAYDGLIQTDWGMRHLDAALAGADIVGGAGVREIPRLAEGLAPEELDAKVRRVLEVKFQLGLFENPYADPEYAASVVGCEAHRELAYEAAAKSLTLLKHEIDRCLSDCTAILVGGPLADNADHLNSGWKVSGGPGMSILDALIDRAGERILAVGMDLELIRECGPQAEAAIIVIGEEASTHQPPWGPQTLEIPDAQVQLLSVLKEQGIPTICVVVLSRPYILTEVVDLADSVLIVYRPGVTAGARAVVDALFGYLPITGALPVQLPRSMEQVLKQREDLPMDIEDPLYDYGYGLRVTSFCELCGN
ncbi:MAG: glycoside hydrolase family 3 N-terminal domain-containing protein [Limnochordia bacterium]|jgi:beta-glucosidase